MSTSDILLVVNIILFVLLVLGLAVWTQQGKWRRQSTMSPTNAVLVDIAGDPGPTFSESTEVGVTQPVTAISPSWPYADFPRSSPGTIKWSQSSFDSVPYFGGKIHGEEYHKWTNPSSSSTCNQCHSKGTFSTMSRHRGSWLREGLEDSNVAVKDQPEKAVIELTAQEQQQQQQQQIKKEEVAGSGLSPGEPEKTEETKKTKTEQVESNEAKVTMNKTVEDQQPDKKALDPSSSLQTQQQVGGTDTKSSSLLGVKGNGMDVLYSGNSTNPLGKLSQGSVSEHPQEGGGDDASKKIQSGQDLVSGSVAEKKPVLPSNAITETVKQRLKLMEDVSVQGQGDMAQPLYLMKLLERHRAISGKLGDEAEKTVDNKKEGVVPSKAMYSMLPPVRTIPSRVEPISA